MIELVAFVAVVVISAALLPIMWRNSERDGEWRLCNKEKNGVHFARRWQNGDWEYREATDDDYDARTWKTQW